MLNRRIFLKNATLAVALAGLSTQGVERAFAAASKRVALIMTGSIADGGWNQSAFEGLKTLKSGGGFETAYAENVTQAKIPEVVHGYAEDGYDLIIGHGFEFGSAFVELAPQYPDQKFFASTFKPSGDIPANVRYVDLAYFDAAYGAGALAALISASGKSVGFVGGGDNPTQQRMMRCFIAGAEATRRGLKAHGIVTGDYDNAARGKEAAETMIANGADVIWHAANVTGLGAIQGAVSGGAKVIGCYSDQSALAPGKMATSLVLNLGWMVTQVAGTVADGSFEGGKEWGPKVTDMWPLKAGALGDHDPSVVDAETWSKFKSVWQDLGAKKIDVAKLVP
jgi:basic membrane protein A